MTSTPTPTAAPLGKLEPDQYTVSPKFNDPNAEITFLSSDNVAFKIFRSHLKVNSAGFSPPENIDVTEAVLLPEASDVLEILFSFIHLPGEHEQFRQPRLMDLEERLFFLVAEAAEKYIVSSLMNMCITLLSISYCNKYPFQSLNHCARHGYTTEADLAAYAALGVPLNGATSKLTHFGVLTAYVRLLFL
ncbi:hypothetical protein D9613_011245 [Agrocybe pediades]|uniref:BTB domain-containing protein n=1 Tax=Agrocybe pediades TaxID=84607 RepID=A0A8H4QRP1_9AGAR|nr:hypothetical protein D9613_011245 [Agrocybe pediades]